MELIDIIYNMKEALFRYSGVRPTEVTLGLYIRDIVSEEAKKVCGHESAEVNGRISHICGLKINTVISPSFLISM